MIFPEFERVVYERNPLIEVICQVRFPRLLRIESEAPVEFQERLRSEYPEYEETEAVSIEVEAKGAIVTNVGQTRAPENRTFHFIKPVSGERVGLNSTFLSYSCNQYVEWPNFADKVVDALQVLLDIYKPTYFNRVGLRYLNIIQRDEIGLTDANWADLISPELGADLSNLEVSHDRIQSLEGSFQCNYLEDDQFVTVRHGTAVNKATGKQGYKIDGDFWKQGRIEIDVGKIGELLDTFNEGAGGLFHWATTDRLRQSLGTS